ncbi:MAG: hypothetical protein QOG32_687 [Chloroflexota bacterium]|jgi:hypothetical protein|nr:hypothetical protein [Chloroflexota bacterium]
MTKIRPAGLLLLPLALILTACASGSTGSPAGSGGAISIPSSGSFSLPSFAIPSFDIGVLTAGLDKVSSYRISVSVKGVEQYKAVVVTKPVLSRDITVNGGTRFVVIGNEAWTAQGSGPLQSVPSQLATNMFAAFDPTLLVGAFAGPQWTQSSLDKGTEQKNGINAHHFVIDSTSLVAGVTGVPPGASINFWIAPEGYLVAWESKGVGSSGDIAIEVTGVDDPANKVERPS